MEGNVILMDNKAVNIDREDLEVFEIVNRNHRAVLERERMNRMEQEAQEQEGFTVWRVVPWLYAAALAGVVICSVLAVMR